MEVENIQNIILNSEPKYFIALIYVINSYGVLKQNQIIFSAYNSLKERRYYLPRRKFFKM